MSTAVVYITLDNKIEYAENSMAMDVTNVMQHWEAPDLERAKALQYFMVKHMKPKQLEAFRIQYTEWPEEIDAAVVGFYRAAVTQIKSLHGLIPKITVTVPEGSMLSYVDGTKIMSKGQACAVFKCICGTEKMLRVDNVSSGRTRSCGCAKRGPKKEAVEDKL